MFYKFCRILVPFVVFIFTLFVAAPARGKEELRTPSPHASITTNLVIAPITVSSAGPIITPLRKDQKAPYDGVLLNPTAVASVIATIQSIPDTIAVEVKKEVNEEKAHSKLALDNLHADLKYEKETSKIRIDSLNGQVDTLTKQIKKVESEKPNLPIWIGAGFIGGIVVTVLTVFAVNQASK